MHSVLGPTQLLITRVVISSAAATEIEKLKLNDMSMEVCVLYCLLISKMKIYMIPYQKGLAKSEIKFFFLLSYSTHEIM